MDSINLKIKVIDELKNEIEQKGKLPSAILNKVHYKFRLDWNYYSNIMEGNTLTLKETRSVMIGNITIHGKPIKDVLEMRGHDETIQTILRIGKGELNISEKRIREIHKGIMHEDDELKRSEIGQWKKAPNYIYNYQGERFDFLKPEDVKDEMHNLTNWLSAEAEKIRDADKQAMHPALLAFQFHIRYLTIHPFYDGNGRTARILMNLILISLGYPPVIIKKGEKKAYYKYLADIQAYSGSEELFYEFMLGLLEKSLSLVNDAINGKDIEEPEDIDKEIELLKQMQNTPEKMLRKSKEAINSTLYAVYFPLLKELDIQLSKFNQLFKYHSWGYFDEPRAPDYKTKIAPTNTSFGHMLEYFKVVSATNDGESRHDYKAIYWLLEYNDQHDFSIEVALKIFFEEESYRVELIICKPYQSSGFHQLLNKAVQTFIKDDTDVKDKFSDFVTKDVLKGKYILDPISIEISLLAKEIAKQTLVLIKEKI